MSFIESSMDVLFAFILQHVIDIGIAGNIKAFKGSLKFVAVYLASYFIVIFSRRLIQSCFIKNCIKALKKDTFESIIDKNIASFTKDNSASYLSILTNDINIIEQDYFTNLFDITSSAIVFTIGTAAIIKISTAITLIIFLVGTILVAIPLLFSKKLGNIRKCYSDSLSKLTVNISDILSGFEIVKGFNIDARVKNEFNKYNTKAEDDKFKFNKYNYFVETLSNIAAVGMFFASIMVGTYLMIKGSISAGKLMAALQLTNSIVNPIVMLSQRVNRLKSVKPISSKILSIASGNESHSGTVSKSQFENRISFENVSFGYGKDMSVLNNINLNIEKGKKYALVGKSGSGKSTLLKLIMKYYANYEGNIYMDNVDIRNISENILCKLISVMHQNVYMFDGTIKDNITLYEDYDSKDIENATMRSGLDKMLKCKPKGILESVGQNGVMLSGGEKQRVAIARALIRKTPVIILDEATSSLDNETAYNIEKSLLNIADLTCIVVTHKFSQEIMKLYDSIVVLQNGTITEQGTFSGLMNRKSYFYSLYNIYK